MQLNDILFEATTTYDEAAYRALTRLMLRKLRKMPRILLICLGILMLVTGGWLFFADGRLSIRASLLLLSGNFITLFSIMAEHFLVRMLMAENSKYGKLINLYQFHYEGMTFSNNHTKACIPYSEFGPVFDNGAYLFLFMKNRQAFILRKSEMRKGTAEELCSFLEKRITSAEKEA